MISTLPYLWVAKKKKKKKRKEKLAGQAKKNRPSPLLSSRSGSASEESKTFKYFPGFSYGKFLRNRG